MKKIMSKMILPYLAGAFFSVFASDSLPELGDPDTLMPYSGCGNTRCKHECSPRKVQANEYFNRAKKDVYWGTAIFTGIFAVSRGLVKYYKDPQIKSRISVLFLSGASAASYANFSSAWQNFMTYRNFISHPITSKSLP